MISGAPISWLVVEVFSLILFFVVIVHASKQERADLKLLEIFGFIIVAAAFENVGVNLAKTYHYDLRRIMMIGSVPLEILLIEASIWYTAFNLTDRLNLPIWVRPLVIGFFCMLQDMTLDPAAVFDRFAMTDAAEVQRLGEKYPGAFGPDGGSGQWNWTNPGYDDLFFGIPFFNYTGWLTMMAYYSAFVLLFRWLLQKFESRVIAYGYPFVSALAALLCISSPVNAFIVKGRPLFPEPDRSFEIVMLSLLSLASLAMIYLWRHRLLAIDLKRDGWIIFGIPVALHFFDIGYAFVQGIETAYAPVILFSGAHFALLFWLYRQNHRIVREQASLPSGSA